MNDDEMVTAVRGALRTLYPEPNQVHLDIPMQPTSHRLPRAALLLTAACMLAVLVLAGVLVDIRPDRRHTPPVGPVTVPTSSLRTSTSVVLTAPKPQPVIVSDRLTQPFSIAGGQIQLTPLPASYQPKINAAQAAALLQSNALGGWPGVAQPPLFLAILTNYSGPFSAAAVTANPDTHTGPTPVWVSLLYVQQVYYGPPVGSHGKLPPLPLGDQITTISAETGRFTSGVDVAGPDVVAITTPPRH